MPFSEILIIELDQVEARRIYDATERLHKRVKSYVRDWMPRTLAMLYLNKLVTSVYSQRYKSPHPYNVRYGDWKGKYFPQSYAKQAILKGDFVRSIRLWKTGIDFMVGVPAGIRDTGGKSWLGKGDKGPAKPIAMYMRVREWGGSFGKGGKHPARPLFTPTLDDLIKEDVPMVINRALRGVANTWR